jgi:glycosyltransferase involved in cell wall biosynthesis
LPDVVFAIPGDINTPTGGYAYGRRVLALLPEAGIGVRHLPLPGSFPTPSPADLAQTLRQLADTPRASVLLIDGLAFGALPASAVAGLNRRVVALVHHPLGLETGLSPAQSARLLAGEGAALAQADAVIVTSAATARTLVAQLGVAPHAITVAEPGADPAPRARTDGDPPRLLAVGTLSPRKAYGVLVEALAGLTDLPWRLTIIGCTEREPAETARLQALIAATPMRERFAVLGALGEAEVAQAYQSADLFVMSSLYEGYGMALAEAMARGLPIVTTTGGAAADTVPDAAGLKVAPGDASALREALCRALVDPGLRARLAEASFAAGQNLPRWRDTARIIADRLKRLAP